MSLSDVRSRPSAPGCRTRRCTSVRLPAASSTTLPAAAATAPARAPTTGRLRPRPNRLFLAGQTPLPDASFDATNTLLILFSLHCSCMLSDQLTHRLDSPAVKVDLTFWNTYSDIHIFMISLFLSLSTPSSLSLSSVCVCACVCVCARSHDFLTSSGLYFIPFFRPRP
jgi:hypothetical protein